MDHPERMPRVESFMTSVQWALGLIIVMAVVSFVIIVAMAGDSRRQTLEAIQDLRKQVDSLKDQSQWTKEDQAQLREAMGELRASVKREGKK